MADSDAPSENGYDIMWKVVGFVFILLIIGTILGRTQLSEQFQNWEEENTELVGEGSNGISSGSGSGTGSGISSGKFGVIGALFPSGKIAVGDTVSNKGEVIVRAEPGGQILGTQKARTRGVVLGGPVDRFQKTWWRMDYKDAPDGWVTNSSITKNNGWFAAFNIFPIVLDILRPFLVFLSVVFLVLILFVFLKIIDFKKETRKKQEYKSRKDGEELKSNLAHTADSSAVDEVEMQDEGEPVIVPGIPNLPTGSPSEAPKTESVKNQRWSKIQSLMNSHNTNDWKQAILEADIILDEMLDKMQYKGDSIGEKLKQVEKSDFITLDKAWEAHKIRNRVAHGGVDWALTRGDAEKAIDNYKEVFKEFYYI